jgi:hypothetical protein
MAVVTDWMAAYAAEDISRSLFDRNERVKRLNADDLTTFCACPIL